MHLSLQDLLAIVGPLGALMSFMWVHFNKKFEVIDHKFEKADEKMDSLRAEINGLEKRLDGKIDNLKAEINSVEKRLEEKINSVEKRLGEKIDAVRDRVSRIEGQLVPAKVISFEEFRPQETTRSGHVKVTQAQ